MWRLLNDPSIPAWINAVTVVVLAAITGWYAIHAKRQAGAAEAQAKAAESQAQAAFKQADIAERQLAILQAQIQEQVGIASANLKASVEELKQRADSWSVRMNAWGQLTTLEGTDILPPEWSVVIEHARKVSPALFQQLLDLRAASRDVSLMIDQFSSTNQSYRKDSTATVIKGKLAAISAGCSAALASLSGAQ